MRDIEQIIDTTANADLDANVYTMVYASAAATPTINGTPIGLVAGGFIKVLVTSISNTPNVFLLGNKKLMAPKQING